MGYKLKLDSKEIANNQFKISQKGYDALEVDTMLDKIVKDYETIESGEFLSKEEYNALMNKIRDLNKQVLDLSIALKQAKSRNNFIQDGKASMDNYELLLRIGKLEKIINEKLHLSSEEINSFDPDDC